MSLKQKAISGAKWTTISNILNMGLHFLQLGLLANILGPTAFGLVGMVTVITGFSKIFADMGISKAIIHKQEVNKKQLSSLYWLNIVSGVFVSIILILITPIIVNFYNEPILEELMYWAASIFVITSFGQQFQILLQKDLRFNTLAKIDVYSNAIGTIFTIFFAINNFGVISLIWGQIITSLSRMIPLVIIGMKKWKPMFHFNKSDLNGFLRFGFYQMGDNILNYFNSNLDFIVIGKFLGSEALGFYSLAYNIIILPVSRINPIITRVAFPVFAKIQNQNEKLRNGYMQVMRMLTFINFPLLFGIASTAMIFIPLIFGDDWEKSILLTQILFGVGVLRSTGNPAGSLLLAKGRADLGFKWNAFLMLTQLPGILIGLWLGGITGVAIAFLLLEIIYCILNYLFIIRKLLGPCLRDYVMSMFPSLLSSTIMGILVFICAELIGKNYPLITLIVQILVGIVLYSLITLRFNKYIVNEIRSVLLKRRSNSLNKS